MKSFCIATILGTASATKSAMAMRGNVEIVDLAHSGDPEATIKRVKVWSASDPVGITVDSSLVGSADDHYMMKADCMEGFSGFGCEINDNDCVDVTTKKDLCLHGSSCTDGIATFDCDCDGTGYEDATCSTPSKCIAGTDAIPGTVRCHDSHGTVFGTTGWCGCTCADGWEGADCSIASDCVISDSGKDGTLNCAHGSTIHGKTGNCHCDCAASPGYESKALAPSTTQLQGSNLNHATVPGSLEACIGECDSDVDCKAGLKCFQREHGETIPGCSGSGGGTNWDYCYNPNWSYQAPTPLACPSADVAGQCRTVSGNGPHAVNVCEGGTYVMQHTVLSNRRSTSNDQKYVCTGTASGGWGVHQAHDHDCTAKSPEDATMTHMWTSDGATYGCKFDCHACEENQAPIINQEGTCSIASDCVFGDDGVAGTIDCASPGTGTIGGTTGACTCTCDDGFGGDNCATPSFCTYGKAGIAGTIDCDAAHGVIFGRTGDCKCTCAEGYEGADCSIASKCVAGSNGDIGTIECDAVTGTAVGTTGNCGCKCADGFEGSNCATASQCIWGNANIMGTIDCSNGGKPTGVTGDCGCNCDTAKDHEGPTCKTISDDCIDHNDPSIKSCKHNSACTDGKEAFTCDCAGTGYEDNECSTASACIESSVSNQKVGTWDCRNGGTVFGVTGSCNCNCKVAAGYEGAHCAQPSPCVRGNGITLGTMKCSKDHGDLTGVTGGCMCACHSGWGGDDCATAMDCVSGYNNADGTIECAGSGTVSGVTGSCKCTCDTGFEGSDCSTRSTCFASESGDAGTISCGVHGEVDGTTGSCSCTCDDGFEGADCRTRSACIGTGSGSGALGFTALAERAGTIACDLSKGDVGGITGGCKCSCHAGFEGDACIVASTCIAGDGITAGTVKCHHSQGSPAGTTGSCACDCVDNMKFHGVDCSLKFPDGYVPPPPEVLSATPTTVTQLVYLTGTTGNSVDETITGTLEDLVAGTSYDITVEVLRNDLGDGSEYVKSITVGGNDMGGECHPDGGDYDCTFSNSCPELKTKVVASATGTASVSMVFTGHSHDCDCKLEDARINTPDYDNNVCVKENTGDSTYTPMKAAARFTATPVAASPMCPSADVAGQCRTVSGNGPHAVNVCEGGTYVMQHTVLSNRRSTSNDQKYVCTGTASGGWGVHQAHDHDCTAKSPEDATMTHMWTSDGATYGCKFDCHACEE